MSDFAGSSSNRDVDPMAKRSAALAFLLLLVFLGGCRSDSGVPPRDRDIQKQIDKMRASARPFYFVGRDFEGLPLTAAVYEEWHDGAFFAYGTCTLPPGQDGGCAPAVEVQIFRFNPRQWGRAIGCHKQPSLLGVPTVRHDGLVLVSKGAVVKIYARTPARDRRVALNLRSIDHPGRLLRHLPAPSRADRLLLASACS